MFARDDHCVCVCVCAGGGDGGGGGDIDGCLVAVTGYIYIENGMYTWCQPMIATKRSCWNLIGYFNPAVRK